MRNTIYFLFLLLLTGFYIEATEKKQTICLNMIVKNETKVIKRSLASVKPLIDYWVIVDTGSTDFTQTMIKEFMKDIQGELHEEPFRNFEYNRNHALKLAKNKADYILFIDADEELSYNSDFKLPLLDKDFYYIISDYSGTEYPRTQLIKNNLPWKWEGVVHEAVDCKQAKTSDTLYGVKNYIRSEGCRSQDSQKFYKDAKVLEDALLKNPNNTRYVFYLAQSYKDAGEKELAIKNYHKRIQMGGWDEEVFWSKYEIARLQKDLNQDPKTFVDSFYKAFTYRPTRAEPLYYLINYYRSNNMNHQGYALANLALRIPQPKDLLFVEKWIYDYGILMEFSICAYWIGDYSTALQASIKLLENTTLPQNVRNQVVENLKWTHKKIAEEQVLEPIKAAG